VTWTSAPAARASDALAYDAWSGASEGALLVAGSMNATPLGAESAAEAAAWGAADGDAVGVASTARAAAGARAALRASLAAAASRRAVMVGAVGFVGILDVLAAAHHVKGALAVLAGDGRVSACHE
jgi:hypothetical protein